TLFAVADVSGKGMPAALLAANIQALVRTLAIATGDPIKLATHINQHLSQYTPSVRFATAVFVLLNQDSGQLAYVNAGHNAPIIFGSGDLTVLEATGLPLGLFMDTKYEARSALVRRGEALLLFTDGLTDSIFGKDPERRLRDVLVGTSEKTM